MNETKEHILKTSLGLFLEKSFKEVTMKEIVDGSEVSKGAFYHYFDSKEQVFTEATGRFLPELLANDYSRCSKITLRQFYSDVFDELLRKPKQINKLIGIETDTEVSVNVYHLLLDAARMLPNFAERMKQSKRDDLKAWKNIISTATLIDEIKTSLNEEQLARLFIGIADGINFNVNLGADPNELKIAWDSLYKTLKS